jgi:hypothetical protein
LDEAREECDAGLTEAVGSKESIVRIALGSIRAQVRGWWVVVCGGRVVVVGGRGWSWVVVWCRGWCWAMVVEVFGGVWRRLEVGWRLDGGWMEVGWRLDGGWMEVG